MNTKKIMSQLEEIEEIVYYVKEYIEEDNLADAQDILQTIIDLASSALELVERAEEDAIEEE